MLADLFAARWLGNGRAIECFLALVAAGVGLLMIAAGHRLFSAALFIQAGLAGCGLVGNLLGWPRSRELRFSGAAIGCAIWSWLAGGLVWTWLADHLGLGDQLPWILDCGGVARIILLSFFFFATLFSVRIMGMALAGLPRSGDPRAGSR